MPDDVNTTPNGDNLFRRVRFGNSTESLTVVSGVRRLFVFFRLLIIGMALSLGSSVVAQTNPPVPVQDLLRLLAQPEVKAWLEQQGSSDTALQTPTIQSPEALPASMPASMKGAQDYMRTLITAVPTLPGQLSKAREVFEHDIEDWGVVLVLGLLSSFIAVGLLLDWIVHRLTFGLRRWMLAQPYGLPRGRIIGFTARLVLATIKLSVFIVGTAGLFLLFDWPPLLGDIILNYLGAAIIIRATLMLGRAVLMPPSLLKNGFPYRVVGVNDETAEHWYFWTAVVVGMLAFFTATFHLLARLGVNQAGRDVLLIPAGLLFFVALMLAIWRRPARQHSTDSFNFNGISWLWSICAVTLLILLITGNTVLFWFAVAAVALPSLIMLNHLAVQHLLRPSEDGLGANLIPPITVALSERGTRIVLILATAWALIYVSGTSMAEVGSAEDFRNTFLRALINALVIVLCADFAWALIRAFISHRLRPSIAGTEFEQAVDHARLRTLLPIVQNILFSVILVVTALMVLASFQIDIAPLIAGAGVAGVAIGFGAQTVVKDMISGIFYMLDDAFRVGEYVQSGSYKGTVESFSIRSVRLRHHRGPIFTVPFGELGAVQNMSRDWAKDKFVISVTYDSDLEKVRKLVKKVGSELLLDPEFGPSFIEPLKMKGVEEFGEYGIKIGFGMMLKPSGQQSVIRRRAFAMIREAFAANGVEFSSPTVQVAGGESDAAAALAAKQAIDRKALLANSSAKIDS